MQTVTVSPITGQTLLLVSDNLKRQGFSLSDVVRKCGYVRSNGKPSYVNYYTELGYVKGIFSQWEAAILVDQKIIARESLTFYDKESDLQIVRRFKNVLGMNGKKCDRAALGNTIYLNVRGSKEVIRITKVR